MAIVYLGLGSNLNDPIVQLKRAKVALEQWVDSWVVQSSPLYQSQPLGGVAGPPYINAVVKIQTALAPLALLYQLHTIESDQGRVRGSDRWSSRPLDIDILLYDNIILDSPMLTIPHYGMRTRAFVLQPLADIAPHLQLPTGESLKSLLQSVNVNELVLVEEVL